MGDVFVSSGPAAGLTVHHPQGSTFGEVFVAGQGLWPGDEQLRRQLVDVAVSRASQAVGRVGAPASASPSAQAEAHRWQEWLAAPEERESPPRD